MIIIIVYRYLCDFLLPIIQGTCTWQFNFKFNLSEDMYAEESVDLLKNSGILFERHEREGIETVHFAEMLIVSGTGTLLISSLNGIFVFSLFVALNQFII